MDKKEKEKVVYENKRNLRVWFYGGSEVVQLITYVVKRKNGWLSRLFGADEYSYDIYQNNPCNVNAYYDMEKSSNGYIISIKSYEKALAMKWITENKYEKV